MSQGGRFIWRVDQAGVSAVRRLMNFDYDHSFRHERHAVDRSLPSARRPLASNLLQHFSSEQFGGQIYYGTVLTVIDVAGRVFMHGSWIYLKDCRQLGAATGEKG